MGSTLLLPWAAGTCHREAHALVGSWLLLSGYSGTHVSFTDLSDQPSLPQAAPKH